MTSTLTNEVGVLDPESWNITAPEDLHITVLFLGDVMETIIPDVQTIIGNIISRTHPFTLAGGRTLIMRPDEPTMLWMRYERNTSFERLVETMGESFKKIGTWERQLDRKHRKIGSGERVPIPHITLARVKGGRMLESLLPPFEANTDEQTFVARKAALFSSVHEKKTGLTHYEKLAEWELLD
jgi:2'-5' RNA ligase